MSLQFEPHNQAIRLGVVLSCLLVYMTWMTVQLQSQTSQARQSAYVKQQGQLCMELTRLESTAGVAVSPSTCTA